MGLTDLSFREALASFPSGVTIVTTTAGTDWHGFTASSFCSVSAEPPLVLACLAETATCHSVFARTERFIANILAEDHLDLALRFATTGADKFGGASFTADAFGPVLPEAVAVLRCSVHARLDGGDHTILVGRVEAAQGSDRKPLVYHRRSFHTLPVEMGESV